jgi:hypothetical protein
MTSIASQRKNTFRFIAVVAAVVLSITALTLILSYAQFGTHTESSYNLCKGVDKRLAEAKRILDPKLVLIGGSGVRRGVNAQMITDEFAVPALNFGLHAALGPEILLHEAKKVLRPGDTALLLFEYNHYVYDQLTTVAIGFLYGCRQEIFSEESLADKLKFLFSIKPARVIKTLLYTPPKEPCENCPETPGPTPVHGPIAVGDVLLSDTIFPPLKRERARRMALYRPMTIAVNRDGSGPRAIAAFVEWARANKVAVIASWPNTILFPEYKKSDGFDEIEEFYASLGVPMIGEPDIGLLPLRYFYDTQYHLNIEGIILRSEHLVEALREYTSSLPLGQRAAAKPNGG